MLIRIHTLAKTANAHIIKHLKTYPDTQEIVTGTHVQTFTHFHLPGIHMPASLSFSHTHMHKHTCTQTHRVVPNIPSMELI